MLSNDVTIIDLEAKAAIATVKVGSRPYGVTVVGERLFVTNQGARTVSVVDLATREAIKVIRVCEYPEGIAASPSGDHVYVACWADNILARIDTRSLDVTARTQVGNGPRSFGLFLR